MLTDTFTPAGGLDEWRIYATLTVDLMLPDSQVPHPTTGATDPSLSALKSNR